MKFLRHHFKISLLTIFLLTLTADGDSRTALVVYVPVVGIHVCTPIVDA